MLEFSEELFRQDDRLTAAGESRTELLGTAVKSGMFGAGIFGAETR